MQPPFVSNRRRVAFHLRRDQGTDLADLTLARQILAQPGDKVEGIVATDEGTAEQVIVDALSEALRNAPDADASSAGAASISMEALNAEAGFDAAIRSVPFRTSTSALSLGAFGAGRSIDRTLGPFRDAAGRLVWIDVFRRVHQVALVRVPGTTPILLLPLRGLIAPATQYRVPAGSVWILAKLLTPATPAGGYCGIRIKGGTLTLSAAPVLIGGTLQIGAGVTATLEIDPDSAETSAPSNRLGADARASGAGLPQHARFIFTAAGTTVAQADDATLKAYGSSATLTHSRGAARFDPLVGRVLIPFDVRQRTFRIRKVRSDLFEPAGEADVMDGAWALAVTVAAPNTLGQAANAGAVAVRLAAGLRADWRGLAAGPVRLGTAILMAEPGRLVLAAARPAGAQASQTVRLWMGASTRPADGSQVVLGLRSAQALRFFSEAGVLDALQTEAALEASLDRPVSVAGRRFPLRAANATLALWQDATGFQMLVVGDVSPRSEDDRRAIRALALTNALLRLEAPVILLISGTLASPDSIDAGRAFVLFGVDAIVPSLRDPYVTNFALPLRDVASGRTPSVARLLASIEWADPAAPVLSLMLLPNAGGTSLGAIVPAGRAAARAPTPFDRRANDAWVEEDRNALAGLRGVFEQTAGHTDVSLLLFDVSSNIDQFGVGFGFSRRFDHVNLPTDQALRIEGLDLSAPASNLRVLLLPQFQWEPVLNLPNPNIAEFFPDRLGFADDGGPTTFGTTSVTLVPIAPERLAKQMLREFNDGHDGTPIGAQFTLPFGMKAAARLQPDTSLVPRWATVTFNQPATADGRFSGALQIAAQSHPDLGPEVESPSFPGAAWQLRNTIDPASLAPWGLSVLSAGIGAGGVINPGVEKFFNDEMGPNGDRPRVPLTRIDFSGYGASAFSKWANPTATVARTSEVRFDVFVGRTAYEVVQVASILYPWAVPVVRTITFERKKEGTVLRFDSGWVATAPGLYRYPPAAPAADVIETHPGVVRGAFDVRRIRETGRVIKETLSGDLIELLEVRFDTDFDIEGAISPLTPERRVTSRDQTGYVQRSPKDFPLRPEHLAAIMNAEGPMGGTIDCVVDIARSGQHLQVARVDVAPAPAAFGAPHFAAAARGALALPRDGEWFAVRHDLSVAEPEPVDVHAGVPLVRAGTASATVAASPWYRIAEPGDVLREDAPAVQFSLVQGSEGHRALFPRPRIGTSQTRWSSSEHPLLADTYTLSIGVGGLPAPADCFVGPFPWALDIRPDGRFGLLPAPLMRFNAPAAVADRRLVDGEAFKIRTRYQGEMRFQLDPTQPVPWFVETDPGAILTTMDLGPFSELVGIRHGYRVASDAAPRFDAPQMIFPPALQPVVDVLEFLATLLGIDNVLAISGFRGSFNFKAALSLPIEAPASVDRYLDLGGVKLKGSLKLRVASAPFWNGFFGLELGAKVPIVLPIFGEGKVEVGLEGSSLTKHTLTITAKWAADFAPQLGPIKVQGQFYFAIQVIAEGATWQIGLIVGIFATAKIWIAKITVRLELLAAIKMLGSGEKEAIGRAKFAAEISIAVFVTISVEYTLEYKERLNI